MKYAKPEILLVDQAVCAIQGIGKPGGSTDLPMEERSTSAYEADE